MEVGDDFLASYICDEIQCYFLSSALGRKCFCFLSFVVCLFFVGKFSLYFVSANTVLKYKTLLLRQAGKNSYITNLYSSKEVSLAFSLLVIILLLLFAGFCFGLVLLCFVFPLSFFFFFHPSSLSPSCLWIWSSSISAHQFCPTVLGQWTSRNWLGIMSVCLQLDAIEIQHLLVWEMLLSDFISFCKLSILQ